MVTLRKDLVEPWRPPNMVGNAPEMRSLYFTIQPVASCDATAFIRVEPGTGKGLMASAIHSRSRRAQGHHLPPTLRRMESCHIATAGSLKTRVEWVERDMLTVALKSTGGNITAAARQLGITPRMVRYKLKRLRIDPRQFS